MRGGRLLVGLLSFLASATLLAGVADLSWTPPTQRTDGSPLTNLAGYRIYYGCAASRTYPNVIQVDNPGVVNYRIEDLPDAGTCYFAVSAVDTDGLESELSNEASKFMGQGSGDPPADPTSGPIITWAVDEEDDAVSLVTVGPVVTHGSTANSDSQNITVPSGAKLAVIFWCGVPSSGDWSMSSISLGGVAGVIRSNVAGVFPAAAIGSATVENPPAGTQALTWDYTGSATAAAGTAFIVRFFTADGNIIVADWDAASGDQGSTAQSLTVDSASDGYVVGMAAGASNVNGAPQGSGQTLDLNDFLVNDVFSDLSHVDSPGASTTTWNMTASQFATGAVVSLMEEPSPPPVEGSVTEASAFGATFAPSATQRVTFTAGIQAASALSGRAVALGAIVEALEAGDTDAAAQAAVAALSAQVETDAQYAAIAQAAAAIHAGLAAGEAWAALAAAEAGITAGHELGATFSGDTQAAQEAALAAGTEAAALFLGAVAAFALLNAGATASDAFGASASVSQAFTGAAQLGASFTPVTGDTSQISAAAAIQAAFRGAVAASGQLAMAVDVDDAFEAVSVALSAISAGVILGATFAASSTADVSIIGAVASVRAIRRMGASVRVIRTKATIN